jgi:hypothetical protein
MAVLVVGDARLPGRHRADQAGDGARSCDVWITRMGLKTFLTIALMNSAVVT